LMGRREGGFTDPPGPAEEVEGAARAPGVASIPPSSRVPGVPVANVLFQRCGISSSQSFIQQIPTYQAIFDPPPIPMLCVRPRHPSDVDTFKAGNAAEKAKIGCRYFYITVDVHVLQSR